VDAAAKYGTIPYVPPGEENRRKRTAKRGGHSVSCIMADDKI